MPVLPIRLKDFSKTRISYCNFINFKENIFVNISESLVTKAIFPDPDPTVNHEQQIRRNLYTYLNHINTQNPLVRNLIQPEINIPTKAEYHFSIKRRHSEAILASKGLKQVLDFFPN